MAQSLTVHWQHLDTPTVPSGIRGLWGGGEAQSARELVLMLRVVCFIWLVSIGLTYWSFLFFVFFFLQGSLFFFFFNHLLFRMGQLPRFTLNIVFPQKLA